MARSSRSNPSRSARAAPTVLAACAAGAAFVLLACGKGDKPGEGKPALERIKAEGKIRVGYANEAPYAYKDAATGALTGEAPEVARAILKDLGAIEMEGVLTEFGSLIPGLQAGRFDLIAAGMYVKPDRCREIAFSNPTYSVGEAFAVKKGNPRKLHSYEDLKARSDATLGVVAGAVERQYARDAGIPAERVVVFPDAPSALAGVRAGRVDAYAGTSLTIQDLVDKDQSGEVERADPFRDPVIAGVQVRGYGAFGFRKQDTLLLRAFNEGLARYIGSPAHLEAVAPFGFTEKELPGGTTAAALCEGG
jgi:polar amino acid transport system substrate-binding protein